MEWSGETFGSSGLLRWLIRILRHSDPRVWYAFAAVLVVPVCLVVSPGARAAYRYFRHQQRCGRWRAVWMTYVNHVFFSQVVIDKFSLYAGKRMRLSVEGGACFHELAAAAPGFVVLSAHVGCYELAGYELVSDQKPMNALVYAGEKATVMENRDRLFGPNHIRMIPIRADMGHLIELDRALADGEIVSIPADRVFGSRRTVSVNLLGHAAKVPAGPFSVPAMRGLDVLAVNVMKTSPCGYTAYVKRLDYDRHAPRRQQVRQLAGAWAAELEQMLTRHPAQWYNYYDFWK